MKDHSGSLMNMQMLDNAARIAKIDLKKKMHRSSRNRTYHDQRSFYYIP